MLTTEAQEAKAKAKAVAKATKAKVKAKIVPIKREQRRPKPPCTGNGTCFEKTDFDGYKTTRPCPKNCQLVACPHSVFCGEFLPQHILEVCGGRCVDCAVSHFGDVLANKLYLHSRAHIDTPTPPNSPMVKAEAGAGNVVELNPEGLECSERLLPPIPTHIEICDDVAPGRVVDAMLDLPSFTGSMQCVVQETRWGGCYIKTTSPEHPMDIHLYKQGNAMFCGSSMATTYTYIFSSQSVHVPYMHDPLAYMPLENVIECPELFTVV